MFFLTKTVTVSWRTLACAKRACLKARPREPSVGLRITLRLRLVSALVLKKLTVTLPLTTYNDRHLDPLFNSPALQHIFIYFCSVLYQFNRLQQEKHRTHVASCNRGLLSSFDAVPSAFLSPSHHPTINQHCAQCLSFKLSPDLLEVKL